MTEWSVVTVIVALVGLIATVAAPIVKLTSTISELTSKVETLIGNLGEMKKEHLQDVKELRESDKDFDRRLTRVETKINIQESEET